jgi:hypothetical protein
MVTGVQMTAKVSSLCEVDFFLEFVVQLKSEFFWASR